MLVTGVTGLLAAAAVGTWSGYRALRPLSSALALQRRFVADAGHELRTPLTLLTTRAFTRFASGAPASRSGSRRYGLGLALVAEIAAAHGGRVEPAEGSTTSAANESSGTILRISLPLDRPADHGTSRTAPESPVRKRLGSP